MRNTICKYYPQQYTRKKITYLDPQGSQYYGGLASLMWPEIHLVQPAVKFSMIDIATVSSDRADVAQNRSSWVAIKFSTDFKNSFALFKRSSFDKESCTQFGSFPMFLILPVSKL